MTGLTEGAPVTSARLKSLGVTPQLTQSYVRNGWLKPLGRGIYERVGDALQLHPSLRLLEATTRGLHVGGKTALDWHGIRHYVMQRPTLRLYGTAPFKVPPWFNERFPAQYHVKRLFDEPSEAPMGVTRFRNSPDGPLVSDAERAMLEMLSEVGVRQPLEEARQLTESTHTLRRKELTNLLKQCRSVKTVRLVLTLGRELQMPWAKGLEKLHLPTGSKNRWVGRSEDGLLVLEP